MLGIAISVYIYNDVTDLEMDRLNPEKRNRPLPSGKVTVKEAMRLIYVSGFMGLALSLLVNVETFLLCTVFMALFFIYSFPRIHLKKKFIIKEGTLAIGSFLVCIIGGVATSVVTVPVIFLGIFLFIYMYVGTPIDASLDLVEDTKYGCKTLAMVVPWKRLVQMFMVFLLALMISMPLTYQYLGFNILFPIVIVLSSGLSLYLLYPLLGKEKLSSQKELLSLYIPWITAQVGVILGTLPL